MSDNKEYSLIELTRTKSFQYSLNELSAEWFEDIEDEEETCFDDINYEEIVKQTKKRAYSTGIYTFCYHNYRQCNPELIHKYRNTKNKKQKTIKKQ